MRNGFRLAQAAEIPCSVTVLRDHMPEFATTRRIHAPVDIVWEVLDDYGNIQRWSPGVRRSRVTSAGPVGMGTTRFVAFRIGGATERIDVYEPYRRMTVTLVETFKLPMASARADFMLTAFDTDSEVTIHYSYTPNWVGRLLQRVLVRNLSKGVNGIMTGLQRECERIAASRGRP